MRGLITAAALALTLITPGTASPLTQAELDGCTDMGRIAAAIMEERQNGRPLSDIIALTTGRDYAQPVIDLVQGLAVIAYQSPRYRGDQAQQEAIQDFRNMVESECFAARLGVRG